MPGSDAVTEGLILDALREEASRRPLSSVLLIGPQACSTVDVANELAGGERVVLLHLDRAAGAVGCGLGNRELFLGDEAGLGGERGAGGRGGGRSAFSVVAVNVEAAKSYRLLRELVGQTARYVDTGGVVLIAGPKKGGAEVAARALHELFESVALVTYRKGHRIYRASGPRIQAYEDGAATAERAEVGDTSDEAGPSRERGHPGRSVRDGRAPRRLATSAQAIETVTLQGRELQLLLDDRIFARGRLDPATRMLAEAFEVRPGAAVLDLGAGNGVLGILAALLEPSSHAWLVDSDPLAVQVSRRNAALNDADNVSVHLSDVLRELPGQTFDLMLVNPPFHRGRAHDPAIAERFIAEASRALRPGGAIYVVCNRFLRYEPTLERLIGPAREVIGDGRFKVLVARRLQSAR
jgi:16S rRNA G1207 methylase RsmC